MWRKIRADVVRPAEPASPNPIGCTIAGARRYAAILILLVFAVVPGEVLAEPGDPPSRVGRLSHMEGDVSYHLSDDDEWSPASLNYPVTTGTSFWTEPKSRAEIQIGSAGIRMDGSTELNVLRLDDNDTALELKQGTINITLADLPEGGIRVETPHGQFDILKPGAYRIEAGRPEDGSDDSALIAVLEGRAKVQGARGAMEVGRGDAVRVGGNPVMFTVAVAEPTDFDAWARERSGRVVHAETAKRVPPAATGRDELDAHGSWRVEPTYGPVWVPARVVPGWAPYRYGHWAYVAPWGWTWIDDAPWGFVTAHYGRWVFVSDGWAWWPGAYVARPVYAPALVAFFGGKNWGMSVSLGGPSVGWVPLGPYEVFRPRYRASHVHVRNVNITTVNTTVINNIHVHKDVTVVNYKNHRGATVVSRESFERSRPVHRATVQVSDDRMRQAHVRDGRDGGDDLPGRPSVRHEARRDGDSRHADRAPGPSFRQDTQRDGGRDERNAQREPNGRGNDRFGPPSQRRETNAQDGRRGDKPGPAESRATTETRGLSDQSARGERRGAPGPDLRRANQDGTAQPPPRGTSDGAYPAPRESGQGEARQERTGASGPDLRRARQDNQPSTRTAPGDGNPAAQKSRSERAGAPGPDLRRRGADGATESSGRAAPERRPSPQESRTERTTAPGPSIQRNGANARDETARGRPEPNRMEQNRPEQNRPGTPRPSIRREANENDRARSQPRVMPQERSRSLSDTPREVRATPGQTPPALQVSPRGNPSREAREMRQVQQSPREMPQREVRQAPREMPPAPQALPQARQAPIQHEVLQAPQPAQPREAQMPRGSQRGDSAGDGGVPQRERSSGGKGRDG